MGNNYWNGARMVSLTIQIANYALSIIQVKWKQISNKITLLFSAVWWTMNCYRFLEETNGACISSVIFVESEPRTWVNRQVAFFLLINTTPIKGLCFKTDEISGRLAIYHFTFVTFSNWTRAGSFTTAMASVLITFHHHTISWSYYVSFVMKMIEKQFM